MHQINVHTHDSKINGCAYHTPVKTQISSFVIWGPWLLTYGLDHWIPRYHQGQSLYQILWLYTRWVGGESDDILVWQHCIVHHLGDGSQRNMPNHHVHHLISSKLHCAPPKCMSVQNYIANLVNHLHTICMLWTTKKIKMLEVTPTPQKSTWSRPPCAPWCTTQVSGAQCRSLVLADNDFSGILNTFNFWPREYEYI